MDLYSTYNRTESIQSVRYGIHTVCTVRNPYSCTVRTVTGRIFKGGLVQLSMEMKSHFSRKKHSKLMLKFSTVVIF